MKKIKLQDVAERSGVSLTTVSRVLNNSGYVAQEKKVQVENALRELGYMRHPSGDGVDRERLIGIVFRQSPNNLHFEKLGGAILQAAEKKNLSTLTLFSGDMGRQSLKEQIEKLLEYKVCGIVIGGIGASRMTGEMNRYLKNCGVPVIFVERTAESRGFHHVLVDNRYGGYLATKHLIDRGHRHLLYINREIGDCVEKEREQGFLQAVEEAQEQGKNIYHRIKYGQDDTLNSGYLAMAEALEEDNRITGVFAWSDSYVAGAMQYLYRKGIRVPEQIELIGCDDTYSGYLAPPVSSVRMPYEQIGETVVEHILAEQNGEKRGAAIVTLEPELVLR